MTMQEEKLKIDKNSENPENPKNSENSENPENSKSELSQTLSPSNSPVLELTSASRTHENPKNGKLPVSPSSTPKIANLPLSPIVKANLKNPVLPAKYPEIPKTEFSIVTSKELLAKESKPRPYIVDKLIPENAITALTADAGQGKSLFALILAYSVANGLPLFNTFETKQSKVLILDFEMDEDIIIGRYKAIISAPTNVDFMYGQYWKIDSTEHFNWLRETIIANNYNLVIFDTLTNIHNKNEDKAGEMRFVNEDFLRLIRETNTTVLYLHHHRKLAFGEKQGQSSARGSTELIAKAASHLMLSVVRKYTTDENKLATSLLLEQPKARRAESITRLSFDIIFDEENKKTSWAYHGEIEEDKVKANLAKEEILKILQDRNPYTVKELDRKVSGVGEKNIRNACALLMEEDKVDFYKGTGRQAHTKFYFLKEGFNVEGQIEEEEEEEKEPEEREQEIKF